MKSFLIVSCVLMSSGCVSRSYLQRSVETARKKEIENAVKLAAQVRDGEMDATDMIFVLQGRQ